MSPNSILLRLEALERKLEKINVRGVVSEINPEMGASGCVRVLFGDNQISDWLPVKPLRSGKASIWWFPEVGEGVTVTDIETGEVMPGSFTSTNPPPTRDPNVFYIKFGDGSFVSHDSNSGEYVADIKGKVIINSEAKDISFNGGSGVVTGDCICAYTGNKHSDFSSQVKAGK